MTTEFESKDVLEVIVMFLPSKQSCENCPQGRNWNHKCDASHELLQNWKHSIVIKLDARVLVKIKRCTKKKKNLRQKLGKINKRWKEIVMGFETQIVFTQQS
jgi:hypothetical protein